MTPIEDTVAQVKTICDWHVFSCNKRMNNSEMVETVRKLTAAINKLVAQSYESEEAREDALHWLRMALDSVETGIEE